MTGCVPDMCTVDMLAVQNNPCSHSFLSFTWTLADLDGAIYSTQPRAITCGIHDFDLINDYTPLQMSTQTDVDTTEWQLLLLDYFVVYLENAFHKCTVVWQHYALAYYSCHADTTFSLHANIPRELCADSHQLRQMRIFTLRRCLHAHGCKYYNIG